MRTNQTVAGQNEIGAEVDFGCSDRGTGLSPTRAEIRSVLRRSRGQGRLWRSRVREALRLRLMRAVELVGELCGALKETFDSSNGALALGAS